MYSQFFLLYRTFETSSS